MDSLLCPITLERLLHAVSVPCCGQSFSRSALVSALARDPRCPLCRNNLENFDPSTAPLNVAVADLLASEDKKKFSDIISEEKTKPQEKWKVNIEKVYDHLDRYVGEAKRTISVSNSSFMFLPNLFVLVVDRSGSMDPGSTHGPWSQVEAGVTHIVTRAKLSKLVDLGIVVYATDAKTVVNPYEITSTNLTPLQIAAGSTNFDAAFNETFRLLKEKYELQQNQNSSIQDKYNSITIAFLTDGLSNGGVQGNQQLLRDIKLKINDWKNVSITIHSVGFSANCDREFLEQLRKSGHHEGMFRYAEQSDDADALCGKLSSIFEPMLHSIKTKIWIDKKEGLFEINDKNEGIFSEWIIEKEKVEAKVETEYEHKNESVVESKEYLLIQTEMEEYHVPIEYLSNTNNLEQQRQNLFLEWFRKCLDQVAIHLCKLSSESKNPTQISILKQQTDHMMYLANKMNLPNQIQNQLQFLFDQIHQLSLGGTLQVSRLYDLRFASQFALEEKKTITKMLVAHRPNVRNVEQPPVVPDPFALLSTLKKEPPLINYSRNPEETKKKHRNDLHHAILTSLNRHCCSFVNSTPKETLLELLKQTDDDKNNALHFAAYCGQVGTMEKLMIIVDEYKLIQELDVPNRHGETPVTLAIKKGGYYRTMAELLKHGAKLLESRVESLQQFAIAQGFRRTAENVLSSRTSGPLQPSAEMNIKYLRFLFTTGSASLLDFIEPVLTKIPVDPAAFSLFQEIQTQLKEKENIKIIPHYDESDILKYAFPPKPDHKETENYLEITRFLLNYGAQFTGASLFRAVEKGSLSHVKFILDSKEKHAVTTTATDSKQENLLEWKNELGNSSLFLACSKRYSCIIEELLQRGANPNSTNLKGNPPLAAVCQMGNEKICQLLLSYGTDANFVNENGDTSILLCCRNNQTEVLKLLIQYVSVSFLLHKAHVDGFDAILAATEANHPDCLQILYDAKLNLNTSRTSPENEILSNANPLHLAAYYNCLAAGKKLIELKIDPNMSTTLESGSQGYTALQIAVIQENVAFVKFLLGLPNLNRNGALVFAKGEIETLLTETMDLTDQKAIDEVWNPYWNSVDVFTDADGNSFLIRAILEGDVEKAQICMKLGANPKRTNQFGVSSIDYAVWMNQPRLIEIVGKNAKIKNELRGPIRQLFFLVPRKFIPLKDYFIQRILFKDLMDLEKKENKEEKEEKDSSSSSNGVDLFQELKKVPLLTNPDILFRATYMSIGSDLLPSNLITKFILNLYMLSPGDDKILNRLLLSSITEYPIFKEEVFTLFIAPISKGETMQVETCMSGSSLWKLASRSDQPEHQLLHVGIFRTKNARFIGGRNSEVLLLPGKYKCINWYHYSPICLGQKSIRNRTFKIKDGEPIKRIVLEFEDVDVNSV